MLFVQLFDTLEHPEAGPDGPLGIVTVSDRSAEHGHDRVPDEFLDRPAVLLDLLLGSAVIELERVSHILRVCAIRSRGESNQVDEEHRDELSLFACRYGRAQLHPTGLAEPSLARDRRTASGACLHEPEG